MHTTANAAAAVENFGESARSVNRTLWRSPAKMIQLWWCNSSNSTMFRIFMLFFTYFWSSIVYNFLRGMCTHSHALFARAKKIKPKVIEPPIHVPAILFGTNDDDDDASDRQIFIKLKWNLYATIYWAIKIKFRCCWCCCNVDFVVVVVVVVRRAPMYSLLHHCIFGNQYAV